MPFFSFGKFLNIYSNMNWAGRCHSSAPFFVIRVSPYDVIPVRDAQLYERCSLGAIPTSGAVPRHWFYAT
ncbi:MAG: hypothetical protein ACR5K5_06040 [Wolbachia sp.]